MPENDVLTMWGPPGTGKTQVLNSIIAMALKTNKKVHVCAPSNAAIDEILSRINAKGFAGIVIKRLYKKDDGERHIDTFLNTTASEFRPAEE